MDRYRYFIAPRRLEKHHKGEFVEYRELEPMELKRNAWRAKSKHLIGFLNNKDKEIERLKKEKEWLIEHYAKDMVIQNDRLDDHDWEDLKKEIAKEMQQALNQKGTSEQE